MREGVRGREAECGKEGEGGEGGWEREAVIKVLSRKLTYCCVTYDVLEATESFKRTVNCSTEYSAVDCNIQSIVTRYSKALLFYSIENSHFLHFFHSSFI